MGKIIYVHFSMQARQYLGYQEDWFTPIILVGKIMLNNTGWRISKEHTGYFFIIRVWKNILALKEVPKYMKYLNYVTTV